VFAVLLARWRHPVGVFALQWAWGFAGLVLPGYEPFTGILVALYAVARRRSERVAWTALAACAAPFGLNSYNAAGGALNPFVSSAVPWIVLTLAVWGFGRLAYATERRARELEELRAAQAAQAMREERLRLARELHDIVANSVSAMILQAAVARTVVGTKDEQVRRSLALIEDAGVQAMGELHRLLGLLRSEDPDGEQPAGQRQPGIEDLPDLIKFFRSSGLQVQMEAGDRRDARLDASVAVAAYRIVHEALTNTSKHGGRGATARIQLGWHSDHLTVLVRDTGSRTAQPHSATARALSSGHGLKGLAERVTLVGGRLDTGPVDGGFEVRADLPLTGTTQLDPLHRQAAGSA
jgi:signal transduction histidine kinase